MREIGKEKKDKTGGISEEKDEVREGRETMGMRERCEKERERIMKDMNSIPLHR